MDVQKLFEAELGKRSIAFAIDAESGRHSINLNGSTLLVCLENLRRDIESGDLGRIERFVDSILKSAAHADSRLEASRIYWCLEPNDYEAQPDFRSPMSNLVDRILVHLSADGSLITWVTPSMLASIELTGSEAEAIAFQNLGRALSESTIETREIDGVPLAFIATRIPFKASLILAPNLKEVVGREIGWPLMAVVPDRGFVYLWASRHVNFVNRVGRMVVNEYSKAPYPISTEVYEITDESIRAIGEFPKPAEK